MTDRTEIPNSVIGTVAEIIGLHYFSHSKLNTLFMKSEAPGDPPVGNCVEKCRAWLCNCNEDPDIYPIEVIGNVIQDYMDIVPNNSQENIVEGQEKIRTALAKNGLSYHLNGIILKAGAGLPSKQLVDILKARDVPAVDEEFQRTIAMAETDPPAAITAASSLVESLCKVYIEDNGLQMPNKQTVTKLWKVVRDDLGLTSSSEKEDDLNRIMSGLSSIVEGVGALRTHAGLYIFWRRRIPREYLIVKQHDGK